MVVKDIFNNLDHVDKILIRNGGENAIDKTFFYLSSVDGGLFEGSAIVASRDRIKMFVYQLEEQIARASGKEVAVARSQAEMNELITKEIGNSSNVGVNMSSLTVNMFEEMKKILPNTKFIDVSKNIDNARMIKDPSEISKIREAARISSEIYEKSLDYLKEGITETELAAYMVYQMMSNGASEPSFTTIVCFGENASEPHHSPNNRKLKKGDYVLTDYGAAFSRYHADTTRTAFFGRATEKQKEIYEIVYKAQQASMHMIKDGVNGKDVNRKSYEIIDATEYKGKLMHGVGHGIGLEVHDHPAFGSADFIVRKNMAVTVEPGIYIPGYGGVRIEDDVLVKQDGFELLTFQPPKELIETH